MSKKHGGEYRHKEQFFTRGKDDLEPSIGKRFSSVFSGLILVMLGVYFLLKTAGFIALPSIQTLALYWPIAMIFAGIAVIFSARGAFWILIILAAGFAMVNFGTHFNTVQSRSIVKDVEAVQNVTGIDLSVNYGAGSIIIGAGKSDKFLQALIETSDMLEPVVKTEENDGNMSISVDRQGDYSFANRGKEVWELLLSPNARYSMKITYGAADCKINLTDLMAEDLSINTGASKTEVVLGSYPTKLKINTGASAIVLKIPEGYGAEINVDGGAVATEMDGFRKDGNTYYNDAYDSNGSSIEVYIKAGASSIKTELY